MFTGKTGEVTTLSRDIIAMFESEGVRAAVEAYRKDKNPRTKHAVMCALMAAGVTRPAQRKRLFTQMMRTRRWGGSENFGIEGSES